MAMTNKSTGYILPTNPGHSQGRVTHGFATPHQDRNPQVQSIPPRRVLPIVFIPGIMGSNLRMSLERQSTLGEKNNIAWRPDNSSVTVAQHNDSVRERQMRLDPSITEVDNYDPRHPRTGDASESADARNESVKYLRGYRGWGRLDGPMLQPDPPGTPNGRSQKQKALERGWGEIFYGSYQNILSTCESKLNSAFYGGLIDPYLKQNILGVNPDKWQAYPEKSLKPLDEKTMREAVKGCWFPVHAMGYNWLRGNAEAGAVVAKRISALIDNYSEQGFQCEKVIIVTHSMGGLVARAAIHPEIGNVNDKVLGIVHGVMPAIGAGAAYRRMRCGVEGSGVSGTVASWVLGSNAAEVTAVLADAQGALELLPNQSYGKRWLELKQSGKVLKSWPEVCPYEEIYKLREGWFNLFREDLINPSRLRGRGFQNTLSLLDSAKRFHEKIADTYHEHSYGHYGVDPERMAWYKVVWEISDKDEVNIDKLQMVSDNMQGVLKFINPSAPLVNNRVRQIEVKMIDAADPGDQTVPAYSSDAQLRSKKFKGIFRQIGYEHQASYDNSAVLFATMYSLFRIISTMTWRNP